MDPGRVPVPQLSWRAPYGHLKRHFNLSTLTRRVAALDTSVRGIHHRHRQCWNTVHNIPVPDLYSAAWAAATAWSWAAVAVRKRARAAFNNSCSKIECCLRWRYKFHDVVHGTVCTTVVTPSPPPSRTRSSEGSPTTTKSTRIMIVIPSQELRRGELWALSEMTLRAKRQAGTRGAHGRARQIAPIIRVY
jgi:hypothetical protein